MISNQENHLERIAQIMSEKSGYKVNAKEVRTEVCTATTSIYSAVICDKVDGVATNAKAIICKERKKLRENPGYEVTIEKI